MTYHPILDGTIEWDDSIQEIVVRAHGMVWGAYMRHIVPFLATKNEAERDHADRRLREYAAALYDGWEDEAEAHERFAPLPRIFKAIIVADAFGDLWDAGAEIL